jgi:hypothetical protein
MDDQRLARLSHELGDPDLAGRLVHARREVVEAVPHDIARRHLQAILTASTHPATRSDTTTTSTGFMAVQRPGTAVSATVAALPTRTFVGAVLAHSAKLAVVATIVSSATIGGLAAAGSLPASAQNLVAEVISHVGVELPRPATPPPAGAPGGVPRGPGLDAPEDGAAPGLRRQAEAPGADRRRGPVAAERDDQVTGADRRDVARDEHLGQRRREPGPSSDSSVDRGRDGRAATERDGRTIGVDTGNVDRDTAPNTAPAPPATAEPPARAPDVGTPAADPEVPAGPDGERVTAPPVRNIPVPSETAGPPGPSSDTPAGPGRHTGGTRSD